MTKPPSRTRPLDRDGDGRDGGSLKGNQTAPLLKPEGEAPPAWVRDNELIALKIGEAGVMGPDEDFVELETVAAWTDDEARAVEAFADAMTAEGAHTDEAGDERNADFSPIDLPAVLATFTIRPRTPVAEDAPEPAATPVDDLADVRTTPGDSPEKLAAIEREVDEANAAADEADDTFTAEEIAAGKTPVVQEEGEAVAPADADPVVTATVGDRPVAVRVAHLQRLVDNRWFYKDEGGYSPHYAPPYIDQGEADQWIAAGLAEWSPSAGRLGGLRVTAEARSLLARSRRAAA